MKATGATDWVVVDGDVEGAVSVKVTSPEECVASFVTHSGVIHECDGELVNRNCDPEGKLVDVNYYENLDPCPAVTGLDLPGLIQENIAHIALGIPIVFPLECKPHAIINSKRKSAKTTRCEILVEPPGVVPEAHEWSEVGGHTYVEVSGTPSSAEIDLFLDDGFHLLGLVHITSSQSTGGVMIAPPIPSLIQGVSGVCGPIEHVNDLRCEVLAGRVNVGGNDVGTLDRSSFQLLGDLWGNGDYSLDRHEVYMFDDGLPEPTPFHISSRYSRVDGNVMYAQFGDDLASVYPQSNGASWFIDSCDFVEGQRLSQWLVDPFGIGQVATPWIELERDESGFARFQRRRMGGHERLTVDDSAPTMPVVREVSITALSGILVSRSQFHDYREVFPGVWRPMLLLDEAFDASGNMSSFKEYRLAGRPSVLAGEPELKLPEPELDRWRIWVR